MPQPPEGAQSKKDKKKDRKKDKKKDKTKDKKDKKQKGVTEEAGQDNGAFFSPDMRAPNQLAATGFTHGTTGFVAPSSYDGGVSVQSQGGAGYNSNPSVQRPVPGQGQGQLNHRGHGQVANMGQPAMRYQNTAYGQSQVYSARPYQANHYGLQGSQQWGGPAVQRPAPQHKPYNMYKWPYQ